MEITLLFTGILGLLFLFHSARTILMRGKTNTNLGVGEDERMLRMVRIHGNFSEYVPLLLMILGFLEYSGVAEIWLYVYGFAVVLGRLLHANGILSNASLSMTRAAGMILTLVPLAVGSGALLVLYFK
jgi:uncharacterized protein